MSLAPRPYSLPSRTQGSNGGLLHCSSGPGGTTSTCPANTTVGPDGPSIPCRSAQRLRTKKPDGPLSMRSQTKPRGANSCVSNDRQPPSSGVTDAQAINRCARSNVESGMKKQSVGKYRHQARRTVRRKNCGPTGLMESIPHVQRNLGKQRFRAFVCTCGSKTVCLRNRRGILQPPQQVGG